MTNTIADKINALRSRMAEESVDLIAIGPGAHMKWLLGFYPHPDERPCLLFVSRTAETFLMPAMNAEGTRQETDIGFHTWDDADGPDAALKAALSEIGAEGARNVVVDEAMRADFALLVLDALPGAVHSFTGATLGALRMRKGDDEYRELKKNALLADEAMKAAFAAARPGMSEIELADVISQSFIANGARPLFRIVGTGGNGAFPHHHTGETVIQAGDVIVIDIGAQAGNYPSDITRSVVVGDAPDDYDKVHAIVDSAVKAAMGAAKPGVKARDVDAAARKVIADAGYGEYFVHRTGHGMGIEVHEPPYITSTSDTVLEEGMVFSIEPGIYLPGRFGIRLEDIVILRADGPEILSELPRDAHKVSV
ncbi:M24 family metallopeptidase [Hoeflea prorocentri]|uniref:M24 family metallopeptidase n=2 Tax=Hoeflea prorocentri TaxID=1922333 RepID=A0A9X3UFH9_9HYPH|nr:M24 family metallopeptidase [Hoeflea prorocentri]MDA5397668.1 M24 family metallopeptidase [Hoeflea prorocentri]